MSDFDFLPEDLAEQDNFGPLPDGWHDVNIARSELKQTRNGGTMLSLGMTAPNGQWVWANINLVNSNEKAEAIGRKQFAQLCRAVGFSKKPTDVDAFVGRSVRIKTVQKEWNGEMQNDVKQYDRSDSAMPSGFGNVDDLAPKTGNPPWMK